MINYHEIFSRSLSCVNNHSKWDGSSFGKIKAVSNTKVGEVGQNFIEELCNVIGFNIGFPMGSNGVRSKQSPWDISIENINFELKTATEDTSGNFQFNHIRYHRDYQGLICLGVSPENLYFNVWSKADVATSKAGHLVSMEKQGNASYKLTKTIQSLYEISDFEIVIRGFCEKFNP